MSEETPSASPGAERQPPSAALRAAIEGTLTSTAGSAAGARERVQDLLDEVTRRRESARDEVIRRGTEAREEIARLVRVATGEEIRELAARLDGMEERLARLESKAQVEG
jgi:polyhydroxyalkanoate synthesis regulator phasin